LQQEKEKKKLKDQFRKNRDFSMKAVFLYEVFSGIECLL